MGSEKELFRDEQILRSLYLTMDYTQSEIGNRLGCSREVVNGMINKYDIPKYPWQDYEMFYVAYVVEDYSTNELANMWETTPRVIRKWRNKHGFDVDERRHTSKITKMKGKR